MSGLLGAIGSVLTGGISNLFSGNGLNSDIAGLATGGIAPALSDANILPASVANSYGTLGLSDVVGTGSTPSLLNLGSSAFNYNDQIMGTGELNKDVGKVADIVIPAAMSYGMSSLGDAALPADVAASNASNMALTDADLAGPAATPIGTGVGSLAYTGGDTAIPGVESVLPAPVMKDMSMLPDMLPAADAGVLPEATSLDTSVFNPLLTNSVLGQGMGLGAQYGNEGELGLVAGAGPGVDATGGGGIMDMFGNDGSSILDWIKNNKQMSAMLGLGGLNALNSFNQAGMMSDANKAQQASYQSYLNALNPTPAVQATRYNTLAGNVNTTAAQAEKNIADSLAARGIRGTGTAAPMGDVSEAQREALNAAYNQIYGTYNVPGSPGPANYAPNAANLGISNATGTANYLLPLMMMMKSFNS
jgi:hypothetical protein